MKSLLILLLLFTSLFACDAQLTQVGGKAASLSRLQQIPDINVPKWFCIPVSYFQEFIKTNGIDRKIEALAQDKIEESKTKEIRTLILQGSLSNELQDLIDQNFKALNCRAVAVRSSCIIEDLPNASCAGIYDTFLNQKDEKSIYEAVKKCWASVFNDRALFERNRQKIPHERALIGVIIQEMVEAQVAGTAFTMEISTGYPGIEIVANYGWGESVVEGQITADKWLLHPTTNRIIRTSLGSKKYKISSQGKIECTKDEQKNYCLDRETVKEIAVQLKKIAGHYHCPYLDTEFAIDQTGTIYFLQARPLVAMQESDLQVIDNKDIANYPLLAKGLYSVPGCVTGKLKAIPSFEALASNKMTIEPQDIVLTYVSTNKWSQYMTAFKGMITEEGSPTSHPILLCRERKVPCVIGIAPEDFSKLLKLNGQWITLDGINQKIYLGKIPLKSGNAHDFAAAFDLMPEEKIPSYAEQIEKFKNYQILLKEGDTYWQKKPAYPLDPLMQEINLLGYTKRSELLGIKIPNTAKVLEGYTVEKFLSDNEKLEFFSHMDMARCEDFLEQHERILKRYEEITREFTLKSWREYVDLMANLRAYIWLGHTFRLHTNQKAIQEARRLLIPRYYIEAYAEQLQSQMVEEDTLMIHDIENMAQQMVSYESLEQLQKEAPAVYKQLEELGKRYRFQEDLSFQPDLDLKMIFNRVRIESNPQKSFPAKGMRQEYFPEDKELRKWLDLAIKSRILQSNTHHKIIRGQWKVRQALLNLGKGKEIFNYTIDEIAKMN